VREIDPVHDPRWHELVRRSVESSVFHTPEWLSALRATYGYEPVAFVTSAFGESAADGIVFCRVNSWLTGRRTISLPFSDHCEPLLKSPVGLKSMLDAVKDADGRGGYVELRPTREYPLPEDYVASATFRRHSIDLSGSLDETFRRFHKSHTQRAIRKAERLGVTVEDGRSQKLLDEFFRLHTRTRYRHGVPVQPLSWFRNLNETFQNRLRVYVANFDGRSVAAMMTIAHKQTLLYKYGGSDTTYNRVGAMPMLFWRAIQDAKASGFSVMDLGRSDPEDTGLIEFKEHLGAAATSLTYYRRVGARPIRPVSRSIARQRAFVRLAKALLPNSLMVRAGGRLYKHFA